MTRRLCSSAEIFSWKAFFTVYPFTQWDVVTKSNQLLFFSSFSIRLHGSTRGCYFEILTQFFSLCFRQIQMCYLVDK